MTTSFRVFTDDEFQRVYKTYYKDSDRMVDLHASSLFRYLSLQELVEIKRIEYVNTLKELMYLSISDFHSEEFKSIDRFDTCKSNLKAVIDMNTCPKNIKQILVTAYNRLASNVVLGFVWKDRDNLVGDWHSMGFTQYKNLL